MFIRSLFFCYILSNFHDCFLLFGSGVLRLTPPEQAMLSLSTSSNGSFRASPLALAFGCATGLPSYSPIPHFGQVFHPGLHPHAFSNSFGTIFGLKFHFFTVHLIVLLIFISVAEPSFLQRSFSSVPSMQRSFSSLPSVREHEHRWVFNIEMMMC
jgi:hypothetical protein